MGIERVQRSQIAATHVASAKLNIHGWYGILAETLNKYAMMAAVQNDLPFNGPH
jgi:hypothetical protein